MPKSKPLAFSTQGEGRRDPWRRLRERPGVRVLALARRSPREG